MTSRSKEAGIQPYRLEFLRETNRGELVSDPSYILYSDNARTFEPSIDPQTVAQDGLGDPDSAGSYAGVEQDELTVVYDLQQWLIDGSGNALDASYDAVARNADNRIPNSHTVVRRIDVANLDASNTINGSTSKDTRLYFVGVGGLADVTFSPNFQDGQPIQVQLDYTFEKGRLYQFDQPGSAKQIAVKSTDPADTSQSVTIEGVDDTGSAAEESVALSGTTLVDTTTQFQEIDAIELSAETVGNVEVYEDDDSTTTITQGDQLTVLYGQSAYDQGEGDLGVPALGTGSHASSLGTSYELPLDGDKFERPSGTAIAENITSTELSVTNNISARETDSGPRPELSEGKREAEVSVTVFGQRETYKHHVDAVRTDASDYKWTASSPSGDTGSITLGNTKVISVGQAEEAQQDVIEVDVTVGQQESVTIA